MKSILQNPKILKILILTMVLMMAADNTPVTLYVIGDSTVANYGASAYPQAGWGQVLQNFFDPAQVKVVNNARGGRSSKTYYNEGLLDGVAANLKAGDYMMVQFGHNDRYFGSNARQVPLDSFAYFLQFYVDAAKRKQATPIMVSPMIMNAWKNGALRNVFTEQDYRGVMKLVAEKNNIPFIDLNVKSFDLFKSLGENYITKMIYHVYAKGDYPNWPDGSSDGTHFQENGAMENARMVATGVSELSTLPVLKNGLKKQYNVQVKSNIASKGLISRTASFPEGAPLTLRVIPANGEQFKYWADESCSCASTSLIYYNIKAPAKNTTYTAMFAGGGKCTDAGGAQHELLSECKKVPSSSSVAPSPSSSSVAGTQYASTIDMAYPDSGNGWTETNHTGYTGEGFWNFDNQPGTRAGYTLNSDRASENAKMGIRYSFQAATSRFLKITVDANTYDVEFSPTADWDTWNVVEVPNVWLDAVDFPLILESVDDNGGPNIDWIGFDQPNITRKAVASEDFLDEEPSSSSSEATSIRKGVSHTPQASQKSQVYDLQGNKINGVPTTPGVYIVKQNHSTQTIVVR